MIIFFFFENILHKIKKSIIFIMHEKVKKFVFFAKKRRQNRQNPSDPPDKNKTMQNWSNPLETRRN
jgi:hypothetical protein